MFSDQISRNYYWTVMWNKLSLGAFRRISFERGRGVLPSLYRRQTIRSSCLAETASSQKPILSFDARFQATALRMW
jgi:hypothetical protein